MKEEIKERTIRAAGHIADSKDTIRCTANMFGISKSTLHHDISTRLEEIDGQLFLKVKNILDENFSVKHIRGGESTRSVYMEKGQKNSGKSGENREF